ncbi:MAG: AcvB/VirJ family lysyl-phosphatidylglycerol hydrolase [Prolixibacteraceae bacterium]
MKFSYLSLFFIILSGSASFGSANFPQKRVNGDLPLKVIGSSAQPTLPMVVFLSGDGGLNTFTQSLCTYLSQKGFPVVILDAKKYFWVSKTPEETTTDMISIVETYEKLWQRDRFVLIGFSFGASLVPFLVNQLPEDIGKRLSMYILINPDKRCDFEIHLSDMLNLGTSKGKYDVIGELRKVDSRKVSIYFGSDESADIRQAFQVTGLKVQVVPGNHHFDSSYEVLADLLSEEMRH